MADERKTENRVIAHFDIDCFYAQSEELRCPSLRGRPIGVTQKFLVVTCNYVARGLGVPKMVSVAEAKRNLPTLVLVNGEDLTPYRADSKRIGAVLRRFGKVERHGLDEGAVDITAQVEARLQSGPPTLTFSGHVLGLGTTLRTGKGPQSDTFFNFESVQLNLENLPLVDVSLLVGSQIVADIRTAIEKETGFQCSCGVAQNKMLAKLSSSLNKPNMQTCLLQGALAEFLAPMAVRRIPGVGQQIHGLLFGMNVETIADLGKVPLKQLSQRLGDRVALLLFNAARGHDPSQVQDKGPPKSISVEDSFRNCPNMQHSVKTLRVLAPDLIRRLDEDREETGRRPKLFTVKWSVQGPKRNFISMSTKMPVELLSPSTPVEKRAVLAVDVATKLLSRGLQEPFNLAVLNIGATNFEFASSSRGIPDMRPLFHGKTKSPDKELKVTSKRDARANRESYKAIAKKSWDVPSDVQFQNAYHLSSSSEDEDVDDLVDELRLSGRQSSLQRDGRQKDNQKLHHEAHGAVPLSRKLFAIHPLAALPVEQSGTCANSPTNSSRSDMKDLMNTNFDNNSRSIDLIESKLVLLETPVEVSILETSNVGYHSGSLTGGRGSERVNICEQCGEIVGDTDSARQEHADYHFAWSLDKRERNPLPDSPESIRVASIAKRERAGRSDPPLKKTKSRNGTLDEFLVRRR